MNKLTFEFKKYRSIVSQNFEIEFGKINYLIGGNESGKSNILKAIYFMGKDSRLKYDQKIDQTKLASWFENSNQKMRLRNEFKNERTSFVMKEHNRELKVNDGGEPIWLIAGSEHHRKLIEWFKKNKGNLGEITLEHQDYQQIINPVIMKIENGLFPSLEFFNNLFQIPSFKDEYKNQIKEIYEGAEIIQPTTYLISPYSKATKTEKLEYKVNDINKANSQIRAIFSCFGNKEQLKQLYGSTGTEIDREKVNQRKNLLKHVNKEIESYFKKFTYLKATPELEIDAGKIYLNIVEKDEFKYEIHTDDENERSTGYKYYSRLLIEIKSLIETCEINQRIIYMIDEPEQSLHPLAQEELIFEIKKLIKNKPNIAIIFATHSIYSFEINDKVFFVERNSVKSEDNFFGETLISNIKSREKHLFKNDMETNYIKKIVIDKLKNLFLREEDVKKIIYTDKNTIDYIEKKQDWYNFIDNFGIHEYMNKKPKK